MLTQEYITCLHLAGSCLIRTHGWLRWKYSFPMVATCRMFFIASRILTSRSARSASSTSARTFAWTASSSSPSSTGSTTPERKFEVKVSVLWTKFPMLATSSLLTLLSNSSHLNSVSLVSGMR